MSDLLIPDGPRGSFAHFLEFRGGVDFQEITRGRAQILRRVAKRHVRNIGEQFEAGGATQEQFLAAVDFEEALTVFIECGQRPDGTTAVA